jgi:hypothetical protein
LFLSRFRTEESRTTFPGNAPGGSSHKLYETVAEIEDPSVARVLIAALKAHGFHPKEGGEHGLPGLAGVYGPKGIPIELPEEEAADGKLLAEALVAEMVKR